MAIASRRTRSLDSKERRSGKRANEAIAILRRLSYEGCHDEATGRGNGTKSAESRREAERVVARGSELARAAVAPWRVPGTRWRVPVSSSQYRRVHASVGPSPVKRRTRIARTQHTAREHGRRDRTRDAARTDLASSVHELLTSRRRRAAGSWTRRRRGWRSAHTGRTRKIRSAKNFLRDQHEFFVVANITARKFGWTRVFPPAIGPRVRATDWSRSRPPPPDGATDLIAGALARLERIGKYFHHFLRYCHENGFKN